MRSSCLSLRHLSQFIPFDIVMGASQSVAGTTILITWTTIDGVIGTGGARDPAGGRKVGVNRQHKFIYVTDQDCRLSVGLLEEELQLVPVDMSELSAMLYPGFACMVGRTTDELVMSSGAVSHPEPVFGELQCDFAGTEPGSNVYMFHISGSHDPGDMSLKTFPTRTKRAQYCEIVYEARKTILEKLSILRERTMPKFPPRESEGAGPIPVKYVSMSQDPVGLMAARSSGGSPSKVYEGPNVWETKYKDAEITSGGDSSIVVSDGECSLTFTFEKTLLFDLGRVLPWAKSQSPPSFPKWGASACLNLDAQGDLFDGAYAWKRDQIKCWLTLSADVETVTYTFSEAASPMRFYGPHSTQWYRGSGYNMDSYGINAIERPCRQAKAARNKLVDLLTAWRSSVVAEVLADDKIPSLSVRDGECTLILQLVSRPVLMKAVVSALEEGSSHSFTWTGPVCINPATADEVPVFKGSTQGRISDSSDRGLQSVKCDFNGDSSEWLGGIVEYKWPWDDSPQRPSCKQIAAVRSKMLAMVRGVMPMDVAQPEGFKLKLTGNIVEFSQEPPSRCTLVITGLDPNTAMAAEAAFAVGHLAWPAGESTCLDPNTELLVRETKLLSSVGVGIPRNSEVVKCTSTTTWLTVFYTYSKNGIEQRRLVREMRAPRLCGLVWFVVDNLIKQIESFKAAQLHSGHGGTGVIAAHTETAADMGTSG